MLDMIAAQYPRLCKAMKRVHGIQPAETAGLILSARYPARARLWTATPCDEARALIASAMRARPRRLAIAA